MGGKVKVEVSHQLVSVTQAKRWLEERKYEINGRRLQREIKPWHVEELTQAMLRGQMVASNTSVDFCRHNGKYYIVNGQHTLMAIVAANKRKPEFPGCEATVTTSHCENLEEVARIFATCDISIMRTHGDALHAAGISDEFGVSSQSTNKVATAIGLLISGFCRTGSTEGW